MKTDVSFSVNLSVLMKDFIDRNKLLRGKWVEVERYRLHGI